MDVTIDGAALPLQVRKTIGKDKRTVSVGLLDDEQRTVSGHGSNGSETQTIRISDGKTLDHHVGREDYNRDNSRPMEVRPGVVVVNWFHYGRDYYLKAFREDLLALGYEDPDDASELPIEVRAAVHLVARVSSRGGYRQKYAERWGLDYNHEDPAFAQAISLGYLKANKAGAMRATAAGKNLEGLSYDEQRDMENRRYERRAEAKQARRRELEDEHRIDTTPADYGTALEAHTPPPRFPDELGADDPPPLTGDQALDSLAEMASSPPPPVPSVSAEMMGEAFAAGDEAHRLDPRAGNVKKTPEAYADAAIAFGKAARMFRIAGSEKSADDMSKSAQLMQKLGKELAEQEQAREDAERNAASAVEVDRARRFMVELGVDRFNLKWHDDAADVEHHAQAIERDAEAAADGATKAKLYARAARRYTMAAKWYAEAPHVLKSHAAQKRSAAASELAARWKGIAAELAKGPQPSRLPTLADVHRAEDEYLLAQTHGPAELYGPHEQYGPLELIGPRELGDGEHYRDDDFADLPPGADDFNFGANLEPELDESLDEPPEDLGPELTEEEMRSRCVRVNKGLTLGRGRSRSRIALNAIADASGIGDWDTARADEAHWRGVRRAPAWKGGELDALILMSRVKRKPSGLAQALDDALPKWANWFHMAELMPTLREVPGWEDAILPENVSLAILECEDENKARAEADAARSWWKQARRVRKLMGAETDELNKPHRDPSFSEGGEDLRGKTLYLVACSKTKSAHRERAKNLYTSRNFKMARELAELRGDAWGILSAEHGLLHPEKWVDPYEKTLNDMSPEERKSWGRKVARQMRGLYPKTVVFLAGERYVEPLKAANVVLASQTVEPLKGIAGPGSRYAHLKLLVASAKGDQAGAVEAHAEIKKAKDEGRKAKLEGELAEAPRGKKPKSKQSLFKKHPRAAGPELPTEAELKAREERELEEAARKRRAKTPKAPELTEAEAKELHELDAAISALERQVEELGRRLDAQRKRREELEKKRDARKSAPSPTLPKGAPVVVETHVRDAPGKMPKKKRLFSKRAQKKIRTLEKKLEDC